jgi:hypothetical protein
MANAGSQQPWRRRLQQLRFRTHSRDAHNLAGYLRLKLMLAGRQADRRCDVKLDKTADESAQWQL